MVSSEVALAVAAVSLVPGTTFEVALEVAVAFLFLVSSEVALAVVVVFLVR
jgi:hypothetical protein